MNYDFSKSCEFTKEKMSCFMEIMHYVFKQALSERLSNDDSFKNYKELLLRHSVQRPPHSLAIFNLDDVKKIDEFVLDSFYRHYDMYIYFLTVRDMLVLTTKPMFTQEDA